MGQSKSPINEQMDLELAFSIFMTFGDISKYQDKRLLAALSHINVNPAQYVYLFTVCKNSGRDMNLSELAQILHVENSTASVTVKRMETAGLVTRKADGRDSRMMRVAATPHGLELFSQAKVIITDYIQQVFGNFSQKEIIKFSKTLKQICSNVQNYIPQHN